MREGTWRSEARGRVRTKCMMARANVGRSCDRRGTELWLRSSPLSGPCKELSGKPEIVIQFQKRQPGEVSVRSLSRLQRKHSTRRRQDGRFLRAAPSGTHRHDGIDVAQKMMYVPQLSSKSSPVAPSAHTTGRKRGTDFSARVDSCFESGDCCTFHLKCTQLAPAARLKIKD